MSDKSKESRNLNTACSARNIDAVIKCLGAAIIVISLGGCSLSGGPRMRLGCLPTATFGITFADPNHLGKHAYGLGFSEAGGILYTCKGGHLDLDHVRGSADITRHLIKRVRETLSKNGKGFSFTLVGEMSSHQIVFTYPENWEAEPGKDRIIEEISYGTGPYLAYNATLWHEIMTWFGVHFAGFEPEFNSAFSWEDMYSNLVGIIVGAEATGDRDHDFDEAMTLAIQRKLKELGVQPRRTAVYASKKVRGLWYTGNLVPDMKMRNFDIGLDGEVTPTLVPDIAGCNDQPLSLPVPTLEALKRHGFAMYYEVKPRIWEQGAIFKAAGSKNIIPERDYPVLLEYMKKEAAEMGYKYDE